MTAYFKSDRGKVRAINEDSGGIFKNASEQLLAVVADGMGGHNAGDVASKLAVSLLHKNWENAAQIQSVEEAINWLSENIHQVNTEILTYSKQHEDCQGMGTTITAAISIEHVLAVGHIGDSRLYVMNEGEFNQITEDHSFVYELVKKGELTVEEAELHPKKNVLTQAVGTEDDLDIQTLTVTVDDKIYALFCTDGLTNKLSDQEIYTVLQKKTNDEEKLDELIGLANERGGEDNITVLLLGNDGNEEGVSAC